MIELKNDHLAFSFPDVHPGAKLDITFQRTLRIPDDDKTYPLPPGLGAFPLRHVDDFADNVPPGWLEHGGVMLPMYQSEAMWLLFSAGYDPERGVAYPCAVKVATGKIDAVTGRDWSNGLHRGPQDYMVAPKQPWLDGYCVEKGVIRQFVAMPLGAGYTAEEQITGNAEHGGLQVIVYPMKREVFERRFPKVDRLARTRGAMAFDAFCAAPMAAKSEMGLAPGGRMKQEIYDDPFDFADWDLTHSSRCFVHIANSLMWKAITKQTPPNLPPTAAQYTNYGLPWFDYYDDSLKALPGSGILGKLKSVLGIATEKRESPLPENEACNPGHVVKLKAMRIGDQVREGSF
ncbi:MAG: hypothetical protein HYX68_18490 [Planctomycetes bacterium]|jgi:hypothetical protein|nr:hypothetical protein [Planctomycetota bacterium]